MNFLEVTEGLEQGKAYRHKDWRTGIYICRTSYGCIQECDGHNRREVKFKTEDILSTDWEECPKAIRYLFSIDSGADEESLDDWLCQKQITCRLSEHPDRCHPWRVLELTLDDLKEYAHFLHIEILEKRFSDIELRKLKEIVNQKEINM